MPELNKGEIAHEKNIRYDGKAAFVFRFDMPGRIFRFYISAGCTSRFWDAGCLV